MSKIDFSRIREVRVDSRVSKYLKIGLKIILTLIVFYIVVIILVGLFNFNNIKQIYNLSRGIKQDIATAQQLAVNRDLAGAVKTLEEARSKTIEVRDRFVKVPVLRYLPGLRGQMLAFDNILEAGVELSSAGVTVASIADNVTKDIRNETLEFSKLSKRHKQEILAKLVGSMPQFLEVKERLNKANDSLSKVNDFYLWGPFQDLEQVKELMPQIVTLSNKTIPFIEVAPKILGFDHPKNYLFLLQNNYELRPTGGFIGTYGLLTLDTGEVLELSTDNVYNLDRAFQDKLGKNSVQERLAIPAPESLVRYLGQEHWSLRDSNWDPDFPSSAQVAISLFQEESSLAKELEISQIKQEKGYLPKDFESRFIDSQIDGVFAITPELIEDLLKISGPVAVQGTRFTAENFQEELEYKVGTEFKILGIDPSQRKQVINQLYLQIKARILNQPVTRLLDVFEVILESLDSKAIMVYSLDEDIQRLIVEAGWAGEIKDSLGDYLMIVDANLGSLKTDRLIKREAEYKIWPDGDGYRAQLTLKYNHLGEFSKNVTRLRNYTRIYVPLGAELLSVEGAMKDDIINNPQGQEGSIDTFQEHGKTVFGAFIAVEPQTQGELIFNYKLPQNIAELIHSKKYNLLLQKQPGVKRMLTMSLKFGKTISMAEPDNQAKWIINREYIQSLLLDTDKLIKVDLK